MKRKFHYILQAKGGVGKSLYTYLRALAEKDRSSLFVDVDNSTKTSLRQLKFLGESRVEALSLLDNREALVRDMFIGYVESLQGCAFEEIFMDFGAPESEQFPALVSRDLDYKQWCDELGFEAVFHIIMAGGGAYVACVAYLQKMIRVLEGKFQIKVWKNTTSFKQFPELSQELDDNCISLGLPYAEFADIDANSLLGTQILDGIRNGYAHSYYPPGARIRLRKELKDNFSHE